jgi:anti-sigma B factor antagonist
MKNAPMLDCFVREVMSQGVVQVCIDLSTCSGMDSTFMGLLVGFSQELTGQQGRLVVVNPTPQNHRLLDMLGVSSVLPVITQMAPAELDFVVIPVHPNVSPHERMELIRRSHQSLMSLNAANQAKFAGFLAALERDLAKNREKAQE